MWHEHGPQGGENFKIAPFIVPYTRGRGLDLGSGAKKTFPHFISMDSGKDYGGAKIADIQGDCCDLSMFASNSLDFVFSSHFLEHVSDLQATLKEWWRVLRPEGHLVLYLPHDELYPRVGQPGANEDHKHDLNPGKVRTVMEAVAHDSGHGWTLVEDEVRDQGNGLVPLSEYSFFQVYRKGAKPKGHRALRCLEQPWRRQEGKSCLVIRYGAFGDHIMASSVLPLLKEQGFHVTYNCEPRGAEILKENPHIDAWLIQDTDQVPNGVLGEYWRRLGERYDRVYNLSESIEGSLLALPGRKEHAWPVEVRRQIMGTVNYLDRTHDLCGVSREPKRPEFHPTTPERTWAQKQVQKARRVGGNAARTYPRGTGRPVILWALTGSSRHKNWPWLDACIASLMTDTDATVVLVGDQLARLLETGWEKEPRVWQRCGQWSIRETLAFAQVADVVVGPETGVLNAVAMEKEVRKVVFLSHSSDTNLTRDWIDTIALVPDIGVADCYPCHLMHYNMTFCREHDQTGSAMCQVSIKPELVFKAITHWLLQAGGQAA